MPVVRTPSWVRGAAAVWLVSFAAGTALAQDPWLYDERHVPQIELHFAFTDWRDQLEDNFRSGNGVYVEADLIVDGVFVPRVGVEHKGDASYVGDFRENMKITTDAFIPGQDFLGYDKITVDAGHQTNVFTEVAALWVMEEFQDTPRVNLAHVVVHDPSRTYDLGVFTNTERVDGRFIDRRFTGDGHRYWQNFSTKPFDYKGPDVDDYYGAYEYQGGDWDTRFADVAAASIALENAQRKTMREELDPFLDFDACMRNIIANRMLGNFDGLEAQNNYYLCESVRHGGRVTPVPWDMDFAFTSSPPDPVPHVGDNTRFPLKALFTPNVEEQRAYAFVDQFLRRSFQKWDLHNRLTELELLALPWMLGSQYDPIDSRGEADAAVARCVNWIDNKRTQLENDPLYSGRVPVPIRSMERTPEVPREGETVWVTTELPGSVDIDKVFLWSRVLGAFTSKVMKDDGAHEDGAAGDGVYGASLPAALAGDLVQYYVEVRPEQLDRYFYSFGPEETSYRPHEVRIRLAQRGDLAINEILADNDSTDFDEFLEAEDWIELHDLSGTGRDLSGYALSDDPLRRHLWSLPDGTFLPAGGYLRIWADGEESEGPLHAPFRLDKEGGSVFLSMPESTAGGGVLLDEVDYGPQREDHSLGRVPDGADGWFHLWDPTALLPVVRAGEGNRYDVRAYGSENGLDLKLDGDAKVGEEMRLEIFDGTPHGLAFLFASSAPAQYDLGPLGPLLVDPRGWVLLQLPLDDEGEAKLKVDVPPELGGVTFYAQALELDTSNGLVVAVEH